LDRPVIRLALWLVAALFAAVMSFVPALAHPGHAHAGPHVADHHVDAMTASINPASPIGSLLTARQTTPLVKIASVASVSSPADEGCHGACCCCVGNCGMGCCLACILGQSPILSLDSAVVASMPAPDHALSSIEPDSLLEPPNPSV
jgi:hypothetical protein